MEFCYLFIYLFFVFFFKGGVEGGEARGMKGSNLSIARTKFRLAEVIFRLAVAKIRPRS